MSPTTLSCGQTAAPVVQSLLVVNGTKDPIGLRVLLGAPIEGAPSFPALS
jgi:hypothetical protein